MRALTGEVHAASTASPVPILQGYPSSCMVFLEDCRLVVKVTLLLEVGLAKATPAWLVLPSFTLYRFFSALIGL